MCGANYLKSIKTLRAAWCWYQAAVMILFSTPFCLGSARYSPLRVLIKMRLQLLFGTSEEMCQSPHHFDQLLHHVVTSICTFSASDLRAWLPITRIKIRPRKQTYWAAKFLVVISWGKPSGSSGIRLLPTQSTDFPESLEHSSVYVACKIVSVLHSALSLVSNATRCVHAFKWTSCSDSLCKLCNTVESTWVYVALPPYHALFVAQPKQRTVMRHLHSNESNELSKMDLKFSVFQRRGSSCYQIRRWSVVLDGHVGRKCWDLDADGHPGGHTCHDKILIPTTWDPNDNEATSSGEAHNEPWRKSSEVKSRSHIFTHLHWSSPILTDLHSKQTQLFLAFWLSLLRDHMHQMLH